MLKVILLEDNPGDQLLITEALSESGHLSEIKAHNDSEEFLDDIESGKLAEWKPQLFLLDINLPKISGFEILKKLREQNSIFRYCPAVMLSTSSFDHDIEKAYSFGASGYMVKSSEFSELQEKVNCAMHYWCFANHFPILPSD